MNLDKLVEQLIAIDQHARRDTARAVNLGLTLRNWSIGYYISRFELEGEDRANYGDELFARLAESLKSSGVRSCDHRRLYAYRDFYQTYPQIVGTLTPQFAALLPAEIDAEPFPLKVRTPSAKSPDEAETAENKISRTVSAKLAVPPEKLLKSLSYSHFELLVKLDDPLQRAFYEVECLRGQWSVRELKRQIGSLYFERSALSKDKNALAKHVESLAEPDHPAMVLRDPMVFEFLGIRPQDTMLETDLEHALLDKLEQFLLELGRGFCFETRQKRIVIGGDYFFVDLVFYHRILKCHVLVELKTEPFTHENLGQLNTYVNWFAENEQTEGDNPPVGILLCTNKNDALVEYATAAIDNQLFVSRYQVALPDKEQIAAFIEAQLKEVGE
ncbi:MAG: PDDEXK nuclease domain-containing protein [Planctomycetota bacterium]